ncbi:MAG: hypothetical protein HY917_00065 [Candidatus Diapherotrites archaeon]|nr:hypothetical protein [Candidatus Diapherotrites archaeon]
MLSDLIKSVSSVRDAFAKSNSGKLGDLAHQSIERAVFSSDPLMAQLSLITYALEKMLSRRHVVTSSKWPAVQQRIGVLFDESIAALHDGNVRKCRAALDKIVGETARLDSSIGLFVVNLMEKAKLKQASTAYALGLSLQAAANLTQANQDDLLNYIGVTRIHDEQQGIKSIRERVRELQALVGG